MIRRYLPKSTEELIHWYERYISPFALIAGFLLDTFVFLDRVDVLFGNVLLLSYILLAAIGILFLNAIEGGRFTHRFFIAVAPYISIVIQFAFGGLFSGYLSLYSRSASFAATWVFVLIIAGLLIGNERFRKLYTRISFQVIIWFTAVFSFLIFFLPVLLKTIGPWMFVLSGIISIVCIALFIYLLSKTAPQLFIKERARTMRATVVVFVAFNLLYFTNVIPPLPLALKEAGVYHTVLRENLEYTVVGEPRSWFERYIWGHPTYHKLPGEGVYVFTAIFAPTGLVTTVRHEWEYYDPAQEDWVVRNSVDFDIRGGRDAGFRGYSYKNDPDAGEWRVTTLTKYGQIIGRVNFTVAPVSEPPIVERLTK